MEELKKEFVGRSEQIKKFWNAYNSVSKNCKVINYYGMTGMGKSTLLNRLEEELCQNIKKNCYIKIDMDFCLKKEMESNYISQTKEDVLLKMRNQLIDKYKFKFKLFDKTLYQYYLSIGISKNRPEMQMILSRNTNVAQAVDIIKDFMGANGLIITTIKSIDLGISYIKKLLSNEKESELSSDVLYENLAKCFALDLKANLEKRKEPLVVFIDTYEMLVKEAFGKGNQLSNDNWLKNDIIKNVDNVLWVIAGRENLKWSKKDEEEVNLKRYGLSNLSKQESIQFLKKAGIEDEILAINIYNKYDGMPMCLNLCIDQYNFLIAQNITPTIENFGDNIERLSNNIIRYMSIEDQEILSYLSCMDNWDEKFIREEGSKFITCFSYIRYNNLKRLSFIEKNEKNQYYILKVAKNILNRNCDKNIKEITKENLSKYYFKQLQKEKLEIDEEIDLLYKYSKYNIIQEESDDVAIKMYELIEDKFDILEKFKKYNDLVNILMPIWERLKENKEVICRISKKIIKYLIKNGKYNIAEKIVQEYEKRYENEDIDIQVLKGEILLYIKKYNEALKILEDVYNKKPEDLYAQEKLALVYGRSGENKKALKMLEDILKNEKEEDKIRITKRNIANTYSFLNQYQKAINIYDELMESSIDELEQASLRNNKANALSIIGNNEMAYEEINKAYNIRKEILGEKHPDTLNTLNNMANMLSHLNKYDDAIKLYDIVYCARKEQFGENNDDVLNTLNGKAMSYLYKGNIKEAIDLLENIYKKKSKIYKQDDLEIVNILSNLAKAYEENGEYEKALEKAKKAYDIRIIKLGTYNLKTLTTASFLGEIYIKMGEIEKGKSFLKDILIAAQKGDYNENNNLIKEIKLLLGNC